MVRPLRIKFPGAWYHVMNRGLEHRAIFRFDYHRIKFLSLLEEITKTYHVEFHAYCLMSNHYHLLVYTPEGNIDEVMRQLGSVYTQYFNKTENRDGPLFRGRYKARLVSEDEYLIYLTRYIHLNPLKAKIVDKLINYQWSSYPGYIHKKLAADWLFTNAVLSIFHKNNKFSYRKYVNSSQDNELDKIFEQTSLPPVIGDKAFCDAIYEKLKSESLSSEISNVRNVKIKPDLSTIVKMTATYFHVDIELLRVVCRKRQNHPRDIAMYLAREVGGYSLKAIGEYFLGIRYTTVSQSIGRAKKNHALNGHICSLIRLIENNVEMKT